MTLLVREEECGAVPSAFHDIERAEEGANLEEAFAKYVVSQNFSIVDLLEDSDPSDED